VAKARKILARAQSGAVISFRDFEALLREYDFHLVRISGSHRIYWHERARRPLSVQPAGKDAKPYQVRILLAMIEEFDLRPNNE
jgi:predicted RNA binding protein YcfA (HicA-like mRNA interferase family)